MKYCLKLANALKLIKVRGGSYKQMSLGGKGYLYSRFAFTSWKLFKIHCWKASTEPKA